MLNEYQAKRDFTRTPEPAPQPTSGEGPPVFVVHKHAARGLHYDLRLELDGVLKSWAVPGGPSVDPADKKLAVMVEDHPFDYRTFEGVIPRGEYGAGEVIIWDRGTYSPEHEGETYFGDRRKAQDFMRQRLSEGKVSFILRGAKLNGAWALVKMRHRKAEWLLIKHHDEFATPGKDILKEDRSVASGLTIEDLRAGAVPAARPDPPITPAAIPGARRAPFPHSVAPMLATLADAPFSDPDWIFEPKLDGYRIIASIREGKVRLQSRRGLDVTAEYPQVIPGLKSQPVSGAVLDGEMVALDESGRPCFQCLQQHLDLLRKGKPGEEKLKIVYFVFDLLYLDGYDLAGAPLQERKGLLQRIFASSDRVRIVDYFAGNGKTVYDAAIKAGLEGAMAKRRDSIYEAGRRSHNWRKMKATLTGEFVVGGYLAGMGSRAGTFGSLMLGYYESGDRLTYAGNAGTGFDEATLAALRSRLDALAAAGSPFIEVPGPVAPVTWVRPELVVEIKFAQWTQEGYLRTPVFLRVRGDKPASDVHRPEVTPAPARSAAPVRQDDLSSPPPGYHENLLSQIERSGDSFDIEIEGSLIPLTNLDKVFWPEHGGRRAITKRDLLVYFTGVWPYLQPHLRDRPLTLTRFPDGIYGEKHFYQKHWPSPLPDFVDRVMLSDALDGSREFREYMVCNNLATLLWLGQIADIELHSWFSRISPQPDGPDLSAFKDERERVDNLVNYPDYIVFDIDPYIYSGKETKGAEPELNRRAFNKAGELALRLKELLDSLSLAAFIKTSGKTGLHIFVPVVRRYDYAAVRAFAGTISRFMAQKYPHEITTDWAVEKRTGKVFLDFNQNTRGKTVASVYSPRIAPQSTVSTPLAWDEIGKVYPTDFTILNLPDRLKKTGDLWASLLNSRQDLGEALRKV